MKNGVLEKRIVLFRSSRTYSSSSSNIQKNAPSTFLDSNSFVLAARFTAQAELKRIFERPIITTIATKNHCSFRTYLLT
jgi:hypothetical protein